MKIVTIVGARPQFIKAFVVSRALPEEHEEVLIHTGQHYDEEMSDVFFDELGIPTPDYNLGVASGNHGEQTAEMLEKTERVLLNEEPDYVLTYGDTNSTLAAAVAASKLPTELAHVEAGVRSYNREMPEEINRVLTDNTSDVLFAPSQSAVKNLADEGITEGVYEVGDVMYDTLLWGCEHAREHSSALTDFELEEGEYILSTVHRPSNTDDEERLRSIIDALSEADLPVVLPAHPRTIDRLETYGILEETKSRIRLIEPVGYLDFIRLLDGATVVATDSGGVQKEAFYLDTPCVTLREETEWEETVEARWNVLVGANKRQISEALRNVEMPDGKPEPYGDGNASESIVEILESRHK